jgi:chlorobactene glucosyltransferase
MNWNNAGAPNWLLRRAEKACFDRSRGSANGRTAPEAAVHGTPVRLEAFQADLRQRLAKPVELFLAAALLLLESLLLVRALRQRAAMRALVPHESLPGPEAAAVEVIVPVRNEAPNIRECMERLVAQIYPPGKLRIVVVDDDSEDGTDEIIAAFARRKPIVKALRSGPLQPGWTGKSQACWRGAIAASSDAEWLVFIDADMRAEPSLLASAVAEAERGIALLSLAPKHCLVSFAERLMIPCGLYLLGFSQNLAGSHCGGEANVAGQFMLIRRSAYRQVGGHAAVAAAICEDLELAKLIRGARFSVALMDGSQLLSTRMYSGWRTLWPGFAKNVLEMFGGVRSTLTKAAVAVALSWSFVILPAAAYVTLRGGSLEGSIAFGLAVAAAVAAVGFHIAGAAQLGVPWWYGLLFPVAYTVGGLIALDGLRRRLLGRVAWKGRIYPRASA